jgi:hypothetical protein
MTHLAGMSIEELAREAARIRLCRLSGDFDTPQAMRLADVCAEMRERARRHVQPGAGSR